MLDPWDITFWSDPSPLPFNFEFSFPNAIIITQRYLGAVVVYFGWTPRLQLLKATFRALTRPSLRNDSLSLLLFWLDPSPLNFKARFCALRRFGWTPHLCTSNAKFRAAARQRHLGVVSLLRGPLGYVFLVGWTPRLCLSNSKFRSRTRFLLHSDIFNVRTPGTLCFGWVSRFCLSNSNFRSLT